MIFTNLNTKDMYNEIIKHLKNITNKNYIKNTINLHYTYKLITQKEKQELEKRLLS